MSVRSPAYVGPERRKPKKRILIVEDNHLDSALFGALAESQGHDVVKVTSADEGLRLARADRPDLIIMDIRLPGMSGFDATRLLKSEDATRDIPVIVTSAYGPYADQDELHKCGCDAYMPTPIETSGFVELIETFLKKPSARKAG